MKAPEIFELDDIDGHSSAITEHVPADQETQALNAVRSCPERAISVS
jgi:ferredoxin